MSIVLKIYSEDSQSEQGLVERPGEERVQQILVDQSQTQNTAAETEPVRVQQFIS